ncbi:hydroxymethylglutaryl-CoA synthase [Asticcacaulis sp. BYS171W]|uniref:Hydroxymethylglutaryl-CoA synthase n=1 Tax=Asticcacaulis aquaticus TaxID=2984212 RepID=A0ABT5HV01_9CAUL|nr:hydroxymethylglutaryl-CoA synthase [Asticcacaulis aquaticus]MDC7683737.1 hydroxymethylglutaryl-CoA synthase [Asticcacaulis aquaticus]
MTATLPSVGIERLWVEPSTLAMDMATLVRDRGGSVDEVCGDMMITERSVVPPWEDPITLAVNAVLGLLPDPADRERIKLLLVASESAPDQEKALSTWVQRHSGLPDDCRNLEVKHACYGGSGALRLAAGWLMAEAAPDEMAVVICTDISRTHFHKPYEFVMGAGAIAMLISRNPAFFALDRGMSGLYTHEVSDLIRPTSRVEAGHSETSLLSYMDAVDIAFSRYAAAVERHGGPHIASVDDLRSWLPHQVYHAPFGGITRRAHRTLMRSLTGWSAGDQTADYARRVEPSLTFNRRMGGTYAASVFISLLGLAASGPAINGQRTGIYSYGSGSTGEFYSGVFGSDAHAIAQAADLDARLSARTAVDIALYEDAETRRSAYIDNGDFDIPTHGLAGLYDSHYVGRNRLVFTGARDHVRRYAWS